MGSFMNPSRVLLLCLVMVPTVSYCDSGTEIQSSPDYLYTKADALYWFALEDGGDLFLLQESFKTLEYAEAAIETSRMSRSDSVRNV